MSGHIVAMGGGGFSNGDPVLDRYVLDLVAKPRPRVAFIGTASGDAITYEVGFYEAMSDYGCEASVLRLFDRTVADVEEFLLGHDIVYVGGGSTANLLELWRLHEVEGALQRAWENGVVLAGVSAGANCWFDASTTDSFLTGTARPLTDGLGLIPGSFCPHYDSEPERRPRFREAVASGQLPAGFACDDFAAIHFEGTEMKQAIASQPDARVFQVDASGVESELETVVLD